MIGDSEQYMELMRIYGEMGDDELLALAASRDDLTEMAQEVLQVEMGKRRLVLRQVDKAESMTAAEYSDIRAFAERAPNDCVWEFAENEDALAAGEWLQSEGVPCEVVLPRTEKFDLRAPRVAVMPEDVGRASAILSGPIPEEFRALVRTEDDFMLPKCRKCGADDPLLESVDPAIDGGARAVGTSGRRRCKA